MTWGLIGEGIYQLWVLLALPQLLDTLLDFVSLHSSFCHNLSGRIPHRWYSVLAAQHLQANRIWSSQPKKVHQKMVSVNELWMLSFERNLDRSQRLNHVWCNRLIWPVCLFWSTGPLCWFWMICFMANSLQDPETDCSYACWQYLD